MRLVQNSDKLDDLILAQRKTGVLCEKLLQKIYQMHLRPGDTFIDVGARVGHHLFPMARVVGRSGQGLGIEANPVMAKGLEKKIEELELSQLKISDVAAGQKKGTADFFVFEEYTGWSSLYKEHVHPNEKAVAKKIKVKIETIDSLVSKLKWKSCDFIKLDIENAEVPALMGAPKLLKKMRPLAVFENSPISAARLNKYSGLEFFNFFNKNGYAVFDIFLNRFTLERWQNDKMLPSYYVAIPTENDLFRTPHILDEYDEFLKSFLKDNRI